MNELDVLKHLTSELRDYEALVEAAKADFVEEFCGYKVGEYIPVSEAHPESGHDTMMRIESIDPIIDDADSVGEVQWRLTVTNKSIAAPMEIIV